MKRLLFTVLTLISFTHAFAQKPPMKLGKVDIEDLQMQYYPQDSSVDVAILCEYGVMDPNNFQFRWQRRIKVFTKEGLNSLILNGPSGSKYDVRGFVMNLVDGKIVKERVSRDHIYIERITENLSRVRVAPPNAIEGSILDIEFVSGGAPSVWQFQLPIPVRHSEIRIPKNQSLTFRFQQIGYELVESHDNSRYIARNMPAFRAEPFLNSRNNYMTSLLIDLSNVHFTNSVYSTGYFASFANSWESVNKHFMEHDAFGEMLDNPDLYLKRYADTIKAKTDSKEEAILMAVNIVRQNVGWNDVGDMYPDRNLRSVWDKGTGTTADMNFLFMNLLRKLDIKSYPLLMSQRSLGRVNPYFPTIRKFNYTIACIPDGDGYLLVDASDKYSQPGMLPSRCINGGGFIIDKVSYKWLVFTPDEPAAKLSSCNLSLDDSGDLIGELSIKSSAYSAMALRRSFDKFTSLDAYLEDFESDNENYYITDYESDIDASEFGDVIEKMQLEISGSVKRMGEMMTLHPVVYDCLDDNPFKLENREYPVDFTTKIKEVRIINIKLTEDLAVEQLPASISMKTESNSASYRYIINQTGSMIQIMINFNINQPVFIQSEYQELKLLFDAIVKKEKENIILKKIAL